MSEQQRLQRWSDSGGRWQVLMLSDDYAEVAFLRCDADEIVERMECHDPELLGYLRDHPASNNTARDQPS